MSRAWAAALTLMLWVGPSAGCTAGGPHPEPPSATAGTGAPPKAGSGASDAGGARAGAGGGGRAGSGGATGLAGAGGSFAADGGVVVPTCDDDAGADDCDGGALSE